MMLQGSVLSELDSFSCKKREGSGGYLICCLQLYNRRVERRQSQNLFLVHSVCKGKQEAQTETQEFSFQCETNFFHNEDCQILAQVAQSEIAIFQNTPNKAGQVPDYCDVIDLCCEH